MAVSHSTDFDEDLGNLHGDGKSPDLPSTTSSGEKGCRFALRQMSRLSQEPPRQAIPLLQPVLAPSEPIPSMMVLRQTPSHFAPQT